MVIWLRSANSWRLFVLSRRPIPNKDQRTRRRKKRTSFLNKGMKVERVSNVSLKNEERVNEDYVGDQKYFKIYSFTEIVAVRSTPYRCSDSALR